MRLAARNSSPPASASFGATTNAAQWQTTETWVRFGMRTIAGLAAGFFVASVLFSISGAVVAGGTVTVEGSYQTVQHRDGGIVAEIQVKNGDLVKRGEVLIKLDATTASAALAVTTARRNELLVQSARLKAERDGGNVFMLPAKLQGQANEPQLRAIITSQRALFQARRAAHHGEQDLLSQQIVQLEDQRRGLQAQLKATKKEARLNKQNLSAIQSLYDKGYASRQRLLSVKREAARLRGEVGRLKGEFARARSAIAEAHLRLAQSTKTHKRSIVDELRKMRMGLNELDETHKTQAAQFARIEIRAPRAGFVHALTVHTLGGSIKPGEAVLQIIPVDKDLLIEARIRPGDVDKVRKGQMTTIRFPAFSARSTPALTGTVSSISAAQLDDPRTGSYFRVLIGLAPGEIAKIGAGQRLVPGMPAEVFIETEPRSLMSYFIKPLTDAMTHAMR